MSTRKSEYFNLLSLPSTYTLPHLQIIYWLFLLSWFCPLTPATRHGHILCVFRIYFLTKLLNCVAVFYLWYYLCFRIINYHQNTQQVTNLSNQNIRNFLQTALYLDYIRIHSSNTKIRNSCLGAFYVVYIPPEVLNTILKVRTQIQQAYNET
jgi:hypothetical protein